MTLNADEDSMNRKNEYNENRDLITNTSAAVTNANGASKSLQTKMNFNKTASN
jgi:hypothetical protein